MPTKYSVNQLVVLLFLGVVVSGCARPSSRGLDSPLPSARVVATAEAAQNGNLEAVPVLIRALRSDDPLVRMVSQRALDRLTGQTFGYSYADSESKREKAIDRWVIWYESPNAMTP